MKSGNASGAHIRKTRSGYAMDVDVHKMEFHVTKK